MSVFPIVSVCYVYINGQGYPFSMSEFGYIRPGVLQCGVNGLSLRDTSRK